MKLSEDEIVIFMNKKLQQSARFELVEYLKKFKTRHDVFIWIKEQDSAADEIHVSAINSL